MSPSSLWAWHSYSWLCFLPTPRGKLSCKCPVSSENCTASRLRERLVTTLLARTASLPSLSEPAPSGELRDLARCGRRARKDRTVSPTYRQPHSLQQMDISSARLGLLPFVTRNLLLHARRLAGAGKRHLVALVSKLVTRNRAVQPFRGEQRAHQHISSEDPDQTQYAREVECRHSQDHDNLHQPEPTFDHLIDREDTVLTLAALSIITVISGAWHRPQEFRLLPRPVPHDREKS